jgi:chromosome partitioning protein
MTTISILNQGGGCGKSTLSVHLACWLVEQGLNVAVIDADTQGTTQAWLKLAAPNVKCFALHDPDEITRAVDTLRPHVDAIVADGPPRLQADARALIKASDRVLMPVIPSPINLRSTLQAVQTIEALGRFKNGHDDFAIACMNMVQDSLAHTKWAKARLAAFTVLSAETDIRMRYVYREAVKQNSVVWRLSKISKSYVQPARLANEELESLFNEVLPHELRSKGRIGVSLQRFQSAPGRDGGPGTSGAGPEAKVQAA